MASNTRTCRAVLGILRLVVDMAIAAQIVKLLFYQRRNFRLHHMTVETHANTGVVNVIVVAIHAVLFDVVSVGETNHQ